MHGSKGEKQGDSFTTMKKDICPHFSALTSKRKDSFLKDPNNFSFMLYYHFFPDYRKEGAQLWHI